MSVNQMSEGRKLQLQGCFVCGTTNPKGLHAEFEKTEGGAEAIYVPAREQEGWPGIIHGGILLALMDEAMSYALFFHDIHAFTARLDSRFRRPARPDEALRITAEMFNRRRPLVDATARITTVVGAVAVAEASGRYRIVGRELEA